MRIFGHDWVQNWARNGPQEKLELGLVACLGEHVGAGRGIASLLVMGTPRRKKDQTGGWAGLIRWVLGLAQAGDWAAKPGKHKWVQK